MPHSPLHYCFRQLLAYPFFLLLPSKVEILVIWLVSVWENWAEVLQAKRQELCPVPLSYFFMHTLSRLSLLRAVPVNRHFLQSGLNLTEY